MKKGLLLLIIGLCLVAIVAFVTISPLTHHRDEPMPLGTISDDISIDKYKVDDKFYKFVIHEPCWMSPGLESREIYEINAPKGSEFLWVHIKFGDRYPPSMSDISLLYSGEEIPCERWPSVGEPYSELVIGACEDYRYYWPDRMSDIIQERKHGRTHYEDIKYDNLNVRQCYRVDDFTSSDIIMLEGDPHQEIDCYSDILKWPNGEGWIYFIVPKTFNPENAIINVGLKKWKLY